MIRTVAILCLSLAPQVLLHDPLPGEAAHDPHHPVSLSGPVTLDLDDLIGKLDGHDGFKPDGGLDIDKDGNLDLVIERKPGKGMMSTYFTITRIRTTGFFKLLKNGVPVKPGTKIFPADLVNTTRAVTLSSVGGSLRFPEKSYKDFSGGAWWGKERETLAVVVAFGETTVVHWIEMSVSDVGVVKFHDVTQSSCDDVLLVSPKR